MGVGFTSRLMQQLREQLGIAPRSRRRNWRPARSRSRSRPRSRRRRPQGLRETIKIIDDLATADVPAAELDKSKNMIRALPAQFETNAGVAARSRSSRPRPTG
jgi:hypothetical protein